MINFIFDYSKKVEFASNLNFDKALGQLASGIKSIDFPTLLTSNVPISTLFGRITGARVSLYRVRPFWGNLLKPHFYGTLISEGGSVKLIGKFSVSLFSKLVLSTALLAGFIALAIAVLVFHASPEADDPFGFLLGTVLFLAIFAVFVLFSRMAGRSDVSWMITEINKLLNVNE